jgi:hypothetical protein
MAGGGSLRDPGRNGQLAGVRDSPAPARGLLRSHLKHVHPISYAGVQGAHTRSHVLGLVPAGAAVTGLPVADPQEVDVPRSQRGQVPPTACCAGARPAPSRPRPQHRPTWHTSAAVTSGSHSGVLVGWRSGRGRQVRHLRLSGPGPSIQVQTAVRRRLVTRNPPLSSADTMITGGVPRYQAHRLFPGTRPCRSGGYYASRTAHRGGP